MEHWLSASQLPRKTTQEWISLDKNVEMNVLVQCATCGEGSSGDLMVADHEDLQESEASEIYVKRFKSQEVFAE